MSTVRICSADPTHMNSDQEAGKCIICQAPMVEQNVTPGGGQAVEFVFVIDGTGSMGNEIEYVKSNLKYLVGLLRANQLNPKLGMVVFRDFEFDGKDALQVVMPLTASVEAFEKNIGTIEAKGGMDEAEHALDGLLAGCKLFSSEPVKRCIMLITDAFTKNTHEGDRDMASVAAELNQNRVVLQLVVGNMDQWKGMALNRRTFYYPLAGDRTDKKAMDDVVTRITGTLVAAG
jgi:Mg-chelatase subunit ChlD